MSVPDIKNLGLTLVGIVCNMYDLVASSLNNLSSYVIMH